MTENKKISSLTAGTTPDGTEQLVVVQAGNSRRLTTREVAETAKTVAITGGTITGITDMAVADGGTGASTESAARTNLGVAIGSDVQAFNAKLQSLSGLTGAADRVPYLSGTSTFALATFTPFGRSLVDGADAAAARDTLELGDAATKTVQTSATDITTDRLARADFVYGPGNLLGTVSQSGGVPTGAVIERGSNGSGVYVRFADGTQICAHGMTTSSSAEVVWTYPAAFTSTPRVQFTPVIGAARVATLTNRLTTSTGINLFDLAGARDARAVDLVAVGPWA